MVSSYSGGSQYGEEESSEEERSSKEEVVVVVGSVSLYLLVQGITSTISVMLSFSRIYYMQLLLYLEYILSLFIIDMEVLLW